ncbi:MAG: hypothetical protein ACE3JP_08370 [Ectobacillus sp.]
MRRFKRTYNFAAPSWLRNIQSLLYDFIIPFTVFQAIRTLLIPTLLDFILLIIFVALTVRVHLQQP